MGRRGLTFRLGPERYSILFKTFKWGIYIHLRWRLRWWHLKFSFYVQHNLNVSTRRQTQTYRRNPRYVTAWRFSISWWTTKNGVQGKPFNLGFMWYAGGRGTQK